ncbi:uncharacterized protein LOC112512429 isoform X1 [Cynara cardunculus var. scolymus]|uniref:uncharacterized protein LOC112512429 isoform X1 n=1 Tax=Cynara cardunculus var. scolymus TaxID=59895 RepID=UPI000D62EEE4|nr:uncharacterized protein LOC112512429 isoform X1 [Cynara cardunculus var. scolymus]XP_024974154.1 uncharacterized protein LOC112512429 isoform X1 [Cynara cardunculus var. scolymus]
MENGVGFDGGGNLSQQLSALTIDDSVNGYSNNTNNINGMNKSDGLFQVMKAVEAAEATIKQQVEENHRLRSELQKRIQELENYKSSHTKAENCHPTDHWSDHGYLPQTDNRAVSPSMSPTEGIKTGNESAFYDSSRSVLRKGFTGNVVDPVQVSRGSHLETQNINGAINDGSGVRCISHLETQAATASCSPLRYRSEGEYDPQFNVSGHGQGMVAISELKNAGSPLKQVVVDTRDQEQEILLLRRYLVDYSIKEAQIHNEKFALEKRIAYMRLAFDQQQQDLVDAASKALSYRQDIIEENIRLTYALQDAQEERSTFVSSLMPLLAEYSLQPPVADAQSIVSNVKVLFRHLQEKLIGIETKLKESQYQLAAWRSDVNPSSFAQSPLYSFGNKNGLELVPQQAYSDGQGPIPSDHLTARGWDVPGHSDGVAENSEPDSVRYSPLINRKNHSLATNSQIAGDQPNLNPTSKNEETTNKQVTFSDPVSSNDVEDFDVEGHREENEGEPFVNWNPKITAYSNTLEDPNSYSPYLTPVLEEPSSSFSEAADDDPLPVVEALQISGEAFPGRELQASGYSLNGTTSCNFEWVRHMEDGSVSYIEGIPPYALMSFFLSFFIHFGERNCQAGAKQPNYLVTADDVDTCLAIEVQPMDNRKRKGELVTVFANEHRKIVCDPDMQDHIRRALQAGHAEHRVSLWAGYLDIWEPVTLVIKKDAINTKGSGPSVTDKFDPTTRVFVPCGNPIEFSFVSSSGSVERRFRVEHESGGGGSGSSRDVIVLTMRFFIKRVAEKKKMKKKGLFF